MSPQFLSAVLISELLAIISDDFDRQLVVAKRGIDVITVWSIHTAAVGWIENVRTACLTH